MGGRGGEGRGVIFLGGGRIGKFLAGGGTLQYGKLSDVLFLVYIIHYSCLYDSAKTACFGKIFLELYTKMLSANQIAKFYKF